MLSPEKADGRTGPPAAPQTHAQFQQPSTQLRLGPILRLRDVCARFFPTCSEKQLRIWCAAGHLPGAFQINRIWFVPQSQLERMARGEAP